MKTIDFTCSEEDEINNQPAAREYGWVCQCVCVCVYVYMSVLCTVLGILYIWIEESCSQFHNGNLSRSMWHFNGTIYNWAVIQFINNQFHFSFSRLPWRLTFYRHQIMLSIEILCLFRRIVSLKIIIFIVLKMLYTLSLNEGIIFEAIFPLT